MENFIIEIFKSGQPFSVVVAMILIYILLIKLEKIRVDLERIKVKQNIIYKLLLMAVDEKTKNKIVAEEGRDE